jgi:hypothetical protein
MKKRFFVVLVVCLSFVLTTWADKPPKDELWKLRQLSKDPNSLVVMTRNIYIGGNVDRILEETNPFMVPIRVYETYLEVLSTDFPTRAQALADEINRARPHLIGLQEVSLLRIGDLDGIPRNAETELFNFEQILLTALADMGLDYYVAAKIKNADVELPMLDDLFSPTIAADVRLTDYDMILARGDVTTWNKVEENYPYPYYLIVPNDPPYGNVEVKRGYVAVNAQVGHKTYTFVNTHLEPFSVLIQLAQAGLLLDYLAGIQPPVILVGDLNTAAPFGDTYVYMLNQGYVDAWTRNNVRPRTPGYTSGHDSDLRNEVVDLDQRIDLIMVRSDVGTMGMHNIGPVFAYVVGDEVADMIENPLDGTYIWPSDHAGVAALLHIPVLGMYK